MNLDRPDVAAILVRKKLLEAMKSEGRYALGVQRWRVAFGDWPEAHIAYFARVHGLTFIDKGIGIMEVHRDREA